MYSTIKELVQKAINDQDFESAVIAKSIIDELADTINCPSNWRDIGERIAEEFENNEWIYEAMELWDYVD